jgi:signal transduction histidine kinase
MAEVASGVIHNIGNTLTSISISSDLVASRLANSRRRSIETLNKLVDPASAHTTPIFSAHAEGPELRTLLGQITHALATDLEETTRLVGILQAGNSHLKSIVSTQQSLARNRHMLETFVLREALQEALLLARTLARHHAPIDECPHSNSEVYADRGLVVHILLNLLINAHDAIGTLRPANPRITLSITPAQDGLVSISVTDNGEGISSEKLLSIFTYGFTTKAKGNGFGLHNSANASRMMGGDLLVTSPGPGRGACFTLRLPSGIPAPSDSEN